MFTFHLFPHYGLWCSPFSTLWPFEKKGQNLEVPQKFLHPKIFLMVIHYFLSVKTIFDRKTHHIVSLHRPLFLGLFSKKKIIWHFTAEFSHILNFLNLGQIWRSRRNFYTQKIFLVKIHHFLFVKTTFDRKTHHIVSLHRPLFLGLFSKKKNNLTFYCRI